MKDVYNDLTRKVGRLEINEESKDYIYCDIRDWGNWEHDYEDYERDEEDFEDDDSMILSESSGKKMQSIVEEIRTKYPTASIRWNATEKNYIDFKISRKQTMAEGGKVKEWKGNLYVKQTSVDYFGDHEGTSKSPTKRWFRVNRNPMTQERLEEMAKPYIEKFGKQNVKTKNFERMADGGIYETEEVKNFKSQLLKNYGNGGDYEIYFRPSGASSDEINKAVNLYLDLFSENGSVVINGQTYKWEGGKRIDESIVKDIMLYNRGANNFAELFYGDVAKIAITNPKMANGGELEDDTFVMLFKGYGFVEKRGSYGTKTFYNRQHNATIYYDPKYRSISGYVGGGEGNDEVIPYSIEGVLDFFIEHDITESEATPFAKGGLLVQVGDKIKTKSGIQGVVYESTGQIFKLMDSLGVKSNTMHFAKDFKKGDIKTYGRGGMDVGRWYPDKSGEEFKYIGEDMKGKSLFNNGQKVIYKDLEDFEPEPKEKKLFKFFRMGGALKEDFLEDIAEMHDDIKEITLKDGSKITHDELMEAHQFLEPDETQEYYASMQYGKGGTFDSKVESISKKLVGKPVPKQYRKEYGSRYDKQDADEAARRIVGNMRKLYGE